MMFAAGCLSEETRTCKETTRRHNKTPRNKKILIFTMDCDKVSVEVVWQTAGVPVHKKETTTSKQPEAGLFSHGHENDAHDHERKIVPQKDIID